MERIIAAGLGTGAIIAILICIIILLGEPPTPPTSMHTLLHVIDLTEYTVQLRSVEIELELN